MSGDETVTTKILLVDDRPQNLLALEAILEPLGQQLIRANSGAEALKQLLKHDFAVILLDVQMPGMDGFETAALIKERELSRHIPIIFLTAISKDEKYVFRGYSVGAVDYLFKPFEPEVLRSKVSVFIDLFRKNERIRQQAELLKAQGEQELADLRRESERRYRMLAESMPQIVWMADARGVLTYGNRRWFDMAGMGEELAFSSVLHPDDVSAFEERWRVTVEAEQTYEGEFRFGSARSGEYRWHLVRVLPVRAEGGAVTSWIGTSTDIDDRKRAEESVRFLAEASRALTSLEQEGALGRVAELTVPVIADVCVIDVLDEEGGRRLVARRNANGRVRGRSSRLTAIAQSLGGPGKVLQTGKTELGDEVPGTLLAELGLESSNGYASVPIVSRGKVLGVVTLLLTEQGRHFGDDDLALFEDFAFRVGVALDNAALYALAQQERAKLEDANRAKDQFLATLSHELRTPLNAILGWTHLLREGHLDAKAQERAVETIDRNAKAQAQLIADLLDVSRIVAGKLNVAMKMVSLTSVLDAALDAVRLAAQTKKIKIEHVIEPNVGEVMGDPDRLQQVVWNLLSNAVKFTSPGGRIEIALQRADGKARIRVTDNGQGISSTFLPYVFDRFKQADSTSTRVHGGLGLGLAIASHLVGLHGGSLAVASEGQGKGATFTVELPIAERSAQSEPLPSSAAVALPSSKPELRSVRVLVVDDDPDGREILKELLEQRGAKVTTVGTASEAIDAIKNELPDLLLCDIGLPGEDGYSLIRRIRALRGEAAALPAAALTAYASVQDRERALAAGFQAHVPKPINPEELMSVMSSLGFGGRRRAQAS